MIQILNFFKNSKAHKINTKIAKITSFDPILDFWKVARSARNVEYWKKLNLLDQCAQVIKT